MLAASIVGLANREVVDGPGGRCSVCRPPEPIRTCVGKIKGIWRLTLPAMPDLVVGEWKWTPAADLVENIHAIECATKTPAC